MTGAMGDEGRGRRRCDGTPGERGVMYDVSSAEPS